MEGSNLKFDLEPVRVREYSPIREEVFTMLREAILNGKLKPGDRLVERELAEQLGVSRTPVREALRKLELENLVTHIPRKGVVVSEISKKDIVEILDIRACLEGLGAREAAKKATEEDIGELKGYIEKMKEEMSNNNMEEVNKLHNQFHRKILEIAGYPRLSQMVSSLGDYISRFTKMGYTIPGRLDKAMKEHTELIEAIMQRNPELAKQIAEDHIDNSKSVILKQYEETQKKSKKV
ncbi:MAG TPA: GntR family transcriptional regulator [Peptococcaceae bacterium]|nr:GntR family transcriptional regulator [Peptococcaceae bacterium]